MSFPSPAALGKLVTFAAMAVAITACGGTPSSSTTVYPAPNSFPSTYSLLTILNPPKTASFDISWVDEPTHLYLLADRSTSGIDVVDTLGTSFKGTAGAGLMAGLGTTVAGFSRSPNAGPNGVVSIGNGLAAAGDGNSSLKVVNFTTPTATLVANVNVPNPYTGPNLPPNICQGTVGATTGTPTVGAGNFRLDELGYDPVDKVIIGVSDNACPVFVTFFSSLAPYNILGQVALTTANGGGEQPVWDPNQGLFLVAIPSTVANPNGEIDVFNPVTHTLKSAIGLPVNCGPSGLALGANETIVAACGNTSSMTTFNAVTFAQLNNAAGPSPDEVWYSPTSNRFYGADTAGGTLAVLDGNGNLIARVPTFVGSHSVAVESLNDHVFVPVNGGANLGINVFDH